MLLILYTRKEIIDKYDNRYNFKKSLNNKEIFKLDNGVYSDKDIVDPMTLVCKKYFSAIITMGSVFYYYDLTDVIPTKTYVATNINTYIINKNVSKVIVLSSPINVGSGTIKK